MRRSNLAVTFSLFSLVGCQGVDPSAEPDPGNETSVSAVNDDDEGGPQGRHDHHQRGDARTGGAGGQASYTLMTLHGGKVMPFNNTYAIWWGSAWQNAAFAGDKITGMNTFFSGFGGSNYAGASTEYAGSDGVHVTAASTFAGNLYDGSAPPTRAPATSQIVAEACKMVGNNPDPAGVYFMFTSNLPSRINYCAWHSWGNCSNGKPILVAYMPNLDGFAGCDPQDTYGTGHSEGLGALANVTAHELSETMTDPRGTAWWDAYGNENGDKCAWTFTAPVTLSNGSVWKLQQEWSNAAYTAGTGNANGSGQKGCLQGS